MKKTLSENFDNLRKILLLAIVFLAPNQLSYHFWPSWSLVYGVRVDYLSLNIYLTEILIFFLLLVYLIERFFVGKKPLRVAKFHIYTVLFFGLNTLISKNPAITLFFFAKSYLLILFAEYISGIDISSIKASITKALYFSLIAFSLIGITQFFSGSTIGPPFNLLGERTFNTNSLGISLVSFYGKSMLRAYSTFSHPNSLAGFYLLSFFLVLALNKKLVIMKKNILLNLPIFTVFLLTFSKSAFLALILLVVVICGNRIKLTRGFNKVIIKIIPALFILLSLVLVGGVSNKYSFIEYGKNISERIDLVVISKTLLENNLFFGVGANNFIPEMVNTSVGSRWLLQPVHNIYLLFFVEFGLLGLLIFFLLSERFLYVLIYNNNVFLLCGFLIIMTTGLFDHYWITIFQNRMMAALFFGLVLNKRNNPNFQV